MIVVTGATGKLGGLIVHELLNHLPPEQIGVSVRDTGQAQGLREQGVRVRQGDFADPERLRHAFEGASQILIISSNAAAYGGDPVAQHRAAIEAAKQAGVGRILYTSHMAASLASHFRPARDHAATEVLLEQAGMAWVALRNGFYASALPMMIGDAVRTGVLSAPSDGKVAWTAHADLAAAAVAILLDADIASGPTRPLTAAQALDLEDVAAILSRNRSQSIVRRTLSDEDQAVAMKARAIPEGAIDVTLGLYRAARAGEFATTDPALATLIGRAPLGVEAALAIKSDEAPD
jgi:uncharacterized protein YbjT (DUF2867 family)